jgi:hypothetical protein
MIGIWLLLEVYTIVIRSTDGTILSHSIFNIPIDVTIINNANGIISEYYESLITLTPLPTDTDRMIEIVAPIKASTLFGYGTYMHHTVLAPYIITEAANRGIVFGSDFVRVTGFAAFLTDYGWVGFGLLIINFICVGLKLILNRSKIWLLLGVSLCFAFGWLLVSNILDNVMWWLLIVPFGILERMNKEVPGFNKESR